MVADQTDNLRPVSAEELGFTEVTKQEASPTSATEPEYAIDTPTSFGIPIPSEVHTPETSLEKTKDVVDATPVAQTSDAQTFNPERHKSKKSFFQRHHKNTRLFIGLGVGLGLLVLTAVAAWAFMFTSTAKIGIVLATKPVTKEAEISVSAKISESNVEDLVLAAQKIQKTVSGENTILTTGVKVVGETSKGTVMVYNKTTAEKEFAAGTVISAGDRDFTFDEAVTVPAATVKETSSGEEKKYGKIDAQVTATDIGADGNLAKETEMTVESFDTSTYEVIVEDDLTGGSSREVRVVSASDQTEALKELQAELETQALQELEDEVASGEYILPKLETVEKTVTFSSDVDDETNEVTASLKLTVEALTYTAASLQPLATRILASEVPEGYVLSEEAPSILSQPLNGDTDASASGTLILANLSSEAIPVVDTESLFQYVLGKSSSDAMRNLEDYEGIKSATVVFNPSFVSKVPADKERVEILVVQDE